MSSSADFVAFEDQLWMTGNYAQIAATAVWLYDYVQTLPMELCGIWLNSRWFTGSSVIFLANRYFALVVVVFQLVFQLPGNATNRSCSVMGWITQVAILIVTTTTDMLLALRVYAMYGRSKAVLGATSIFIISAFAYNTWSLTLEKGVSIKGSPYGFNRFSQCSMQVQYYADNTLIDGLETSTPFRILGFQILVLGLTVKKTYHHSKEARKHELLSIAHVVLQDGVLYFLAIFMLNCLQAAETIDTLVKDGNLSGLELSYGTVIQAFFVLIPNILVNRLFLNLRTFDASGPEKGHTDRRGKVTELAFAQNRFLGTIGAPLDHDQWDNTALSSDVHDDEVTSTIHGHLRSSEIELDSVGNVATLVSEV